MAIKIDGSGITSANIVADAINGSKIADDAIDSDHFAAGSIDDAHLATGITSSKLTGALPAISGASLTGITATLSGMSDATVSASDPTVSTNPSATGHFWINKTTGKEYICTSVSAGANIWKNVGGLSGNIS